MFIAYTRCSLLINYTSVYILIFHFIFAFFICLVFLCQSFIFISPEQNHFIPKLVNRDLIVPIVPHQLLLFGSHSVKSLTFLLSRFICVWMQSAEKHCSSFSSPRVIFFIILLLFHKKNILQMHSSWNGYSFSQRKKSSKQNLLSLLHERWVLPQAQRVL